MKKKEIINDFINFVKTDSESLNEKKFVELLKTKFRKLNPSKIYVDNTGKIINGNTGNLIIKFKGKNNNSLPLMLSAHLDTVKPGKNITPIIKNNYILSNGLTILGADDKIGITAIYHALKNIVDNNLSYPPIEIVFTVAEEIGLLGAKNIDYKKIKSKHCYVFDASGEIGTIITHAPTHIKYTIKVYGKEAHAGINPDKGKNAIIIASHIITQLESKRIDNFTTTNVGIIKGGTATNIVPNYTEIEGEFRSITDENLQKIKNHLFNVVNTVKNKFNTKISLSFKTEYEKMALSEDSLLVKNFVDTAKKLKLKTKISSTTGGSDASIINKFGIETANIAVEFINPHAVKEKIKIDSFYKLTDLIQNLILNWNY